MSPHGQTHFQRQAKKYTVAGVILALLSSSGGTFLVREWKDQIKTNSVLQTTANTARVEAESKAREAKEAAERIAALMSEVKVLHQAGEEQKRQFDAFVSISSADRKDLHGVDQKIIENFNANMQAFVEKNNDAHLSIERSLSQIKGALGIKLTDTDSQAMTKKAGEQ
jgi:molybdopterin synthase catalytic subunit